MKQRPATQPEMPATQTQPSRGIPCWEKLSSETRQAIMIALTTMMVKRLPGRDKERDDE
jgi:predicted Fe-S protein YdhL (DUF1289 family)